MALSKNDVLHVSTLAKLELTGAEIKKFLPQLISIVDHVTELQKVDTTGIEPTSQTTRLINVFRADTIVISSIDQNGALSGTDKIYNGYFKVPAILEGRTDK